MSKSKSILSLLALVLMSLSVTACNTVEGAGRDIEAAGEEVQEAAADVGD